MRDHFRRLFAYAAWANARALAAVRSTPDPAEGLRLLGHVLAAEHVWLSRLRGTAPAHPVWPALTADECAGLAEENRAGYAAFLDGLTDEDFPRRVRYRTTKGVEYETAVADILTHVATHGGYHRGQIARAVRAGGGVPVDTDFIIFVREE
ncbi:MAG TPA: DinB family protein [Gemmataceae bacterium]|jgi:uncharacterized damage-inducible protein DinB